jgi:hypothetical protein
VAPPCSETDACWSLQDVGGKPRVTRPREPAQASRSPGSLGRDLAAARGSLAAARGGLAAPTYRRPGRATAPGDADRPGRRAWERIRARARRACPGARASARAPVRTPSSMAGQGPAAGPCRETTAAPGRDPDRAAGPGLGTASRGLGSAGAASPRRGSRAARGLDLDRAAARCRAGTRGSAALPRSSRGQLMRKGSLGSMSG